MADPARAAQLGIAARAHARGFSFATMVVALEHLYLTEWTRRARIRSAGEDSVAGNLASPASHG
jgi:hypothetical protein